MIFPLTVYSKELTACYKAYFFIFPVARSCITYKITGGILEVKSFIETVGVGKLAHRVKDEGGARIKLGSLHPEHFFFHQEEGRFKRTMLYYFDEKNNSIKVNVTKYRGLTEKVEKTVKKTYSYDGYKDPFTASIYLYTEVGKRKRGYLKVFYDGKKYKIPYFLVGSEFIEGREVWLVEVEPDMETRGLLKPKGKWYLWIDKERRIPLKMELEFTLGSTLVKLEEIKGEKDIISELAE